MRTRIGGLLARAVPRTAGRRALAAALAAVVTAPFLVSPPDTSREVQEAQQVAVAPSRTATDVERAGADPSPAPPPVGAETAPAAPSPAGRPLVAPRPVVSEDVEPVRPDLIVRPNKVDPDGLFSVLRMQGVRHLAGAREVHFTVNGPTGPSKLRFLVVDPLAFRPLTPDATARTREVWERLVDGEVVVRHDIAQQLQLPLGGTVAVTGRNGTTLDLRIGAYASNGTPPLAAALVPWEVGRELGAGQPNVLVIAVDDAAEPERIGAEVVEALGGGDLTELEPPVEQRARLVGAGSAHFEPFSYVDHGDGMITIDPAWVRRNIVSFQVPIFGGIARCHRVMAPQLVAALQEVERAGLAHLIDRNDYGGCWVPRHILFDPSRALSMHAWGLAVDFNVRTNQYGAQPTLDGRIVEIFERWGFEWGGRWSVPDGMHFELRAVIQR